MLLMLDSNLTLVIFMSLGLGIAAPYLALSFIPAALKWIPKPGMWMTRVKSGFGVVIFAFALWYGYLGWNLSGFGQPLAEAATPST